MQEEIDREKQKVLAEQQKGQDYMRERDLLTKNLQKAISMSSFSFMFISLHVLSGVSFLGAVCGSLYVVLMTLCFCTDATSLQREERDVLEKQITVLDHEIQSYKTEAQNFRKVRPSS